MSDSSFASLGPSLLARKGGAKPAMRPQVAPLVVDQAAVPEEALEDLGWNDMGDSDHDTALADGAEVVPINGDVAADGHGAGISPVVRRQQRRLEERVLADAAMTGPEDTDSEYDALGDDESEDYEAEDYESDDYDDGPIYGESYLDSDEDEGEEDVSDAAFASLAPTQAPIAVPVSVPAPAPAPRPARKPAAQSGRRAAFTLRLDAERHLKLRLAATMQQVSAQALVTEALDRLLAEYDDLDVIAKHLKRH
ncbi:hypothetical protein [Porphyrobacter sp. YT40]|uniref:hypothetical protein n=1 Tax=Porphyrobacter sp. YT40 TaxID=2547601 RepID=UPI001143195E|nr:hypothetical protein [Porphyrobacter sp. YT40]QDH34063.1 hypothetical protein E2E27_06785 [Porphyrobacter sp. YT40]